MKGIRWYHDNEQADNRKMKARNAFSATVPVLSAALSDELASKELPYRAGSGRFGLAAMNQHEKDARPKERGKAQ
jgi:hypothetical protein